MCVLGMNARISHAKGNTVWMTMPAKTKIRTLDEMERHDKKRSQSCSS